MIPHADGDPREWQRPHSRMMTKSDLARKGCCAKCGVNRGIGRDKRGNVGAGCGRSEDSTSVCASGFPGSGASVHEGGGVGDEGGRGNFFPQRESSSFLFTRLVRRGRIHPLDLSRLGNEFHTNASANTGARRKRGHSPSARRLAIGVRRIGLLSGVFVSSNSRPRGE